MLGWCAIHRSRYIGAATNTETPAALERPLHSSVMHTSTSEAAAC